MSQKPIFARLKSSVVTKNNQSTLFRWFLLNHDRFAKVRAKAARPGWLTIAAELTAEGLTTSSGGPITAEYARQAWSRAHKAYEARASSVPAKGRQPKKAVAQPAAAHALPPEAVLHSPTDAGCEDEPAPRMRLRRNNSLVNGPPPTKPKE